MMVIVSGRCNFTTQRASSNFVHYPRLNANCAIRSALLLLFDCYSCQF
jgi:hypothetical protein